MGEGGFVEGLLDGEFVVEVGLLFLVVFVGGEYGVGRMESFVGVEVVEMMGKVVSVGLDIMGLLELTFPFLFIHYLY